MSTASLMTNKEKANLARIRDNQRRSRARRKEYLQELEARLRQCELQGIEASAEIQLAARRVADENKKLRVLLAQNGIGEDSIDAYLNSSPTADGLTSGQYGASSGNAVQILEQLLQTRKTCCVDGSVPIQHTVTRSRDSSASISTIQSPWDSVHPQSADGRRLSMALPTSGKAASSAQQFMTPSTTASRTSSISASHNPNRGVSHHQRIAPVQQMPRNPSPASNSSSRQSQMFDFNTGYSLHQSSSYDNNSVLGTAQKHLQPYSAPQRSSVYIPTTTTSANVNSCDYATDMITTMAGADPASVRADLGCTPGMDCDVDNHLVFNVLDRYSGGVGL
ncbi:hypothetical protein G7Y89_g1909 [Cudoniella acicularis]|uniref:BZIP domain-containing protein n=1 Tax=Cudoniella acicularis TaxID=354080 RepID=A0A8H4RUB8_9HELO|nr:hypothetical protein G7Y89_g1909 [Cudoniella acicularis]